jgi:hypothetical protein
LKNKLLVVQDQQSNTSNVKLLEQVIAQEKSNQEFLDALRSGMYDLAHMLPGSRTWLDLYGEKMEMASNHSKEREEELKSLLSKDESMSDDTW